MFNQVIECVPNYSTGRDPEKLQKILDVFKDADNVKILDYSSDADHNRSVVTLIGTAEGLLDRVVKSVGVAAEVIDLRTHEGAHPRMGATDVVPFIPIKNATVEDCIALSKQVAEAIAEKFQIPCYLYEESATSKDRKNLATIRKGQFEGFAEKITQPEWKPDYGEAKVHPSAGVTAVGARMPLVAFNINLGTPDVEIASKIAKKIRHIGGGFRFVKAMGVDMSEKGIAQVSINMTNYQKSTLYNVFEMVKSEAARYGVNVVGSEIVGLAPMECLVDIATFYLGLHEFTLDQVIEYRLLSD